MEREENIAVTLARHGYATTKQVVRLLHKELALLSAEEIAALDEEDLLNIVFAAQIDEEAQGYSGERQARVDALWLDEQDPMWYPHGNHTLTLAGGVVDALAVHRTGPDTQWTLYSSLDEFLSPSGPLQETCSRKYSTPEEGKQAGLRALLETLEGWVRQLRGVTL